MFRLRIIITQQFSRSSRFLRGSVETGITNVFFPIAFCPDYSGSAILVNNFHFPRSAVFHTSSVHFTHSTTSLSVFLFLSFLLYTLFSLISLPLSLLILHHVRAILIYSLAVCLLSKPHSYTASRILISYFVTSSHYTRPKLTFSSLLHSSSVLSSYLLPDILIRAMV